MVSLTFNNYENTVLNMSCQGNVILCWQHRNAHKLGRAVPVNKRREEALLMGVTYVPSLDFKACCFAY